MKKITLLFFFLSTSLIFAQTTIGESDLFSTTTNATYTHFYAANTLGDGNTGEQVEFKINITTLPVGGESYRIGKSLANGTSWYFSDAKTLTEGLNTITVAAVSFNRAVKIQFTSSALAFDSIILNDETIFDDTASAPVRDGATDTISNSPVFDTTTSATWGFVTTLCTAAEGASTQSAQTFKIYITDLPTDGANYRVVKTVANGNWNNGNAQALSEGLNTITVSGVSFDRSVKLQFSSGDIEYNSITINGNPVTLGIADYNAKFLVISPNPSTDIISISGIENIKSIKVYSILGALEKEVFKTNQIDVSELSSGIHIVKVDNGTVFSKKIIKQ